MQRERSTRQKIDAPRPADKIDFNNNNKNKQTLLTTNLTVF